MKRITLFYGITTGLFLIIVMILLIPIWADNNDFKTGEIIGYVVIFLACFIILMGIRKYGKSTIDGKLSFGNGFLVGFLITVVASTIYAIGWMIYSNYINPEFMESYYTYSIEQLRESELPPEELEEKLLEMEQFKEYYQEPIIQFAFTVLEVFPIGLIFSIIGGFVFRRK